MRSGPFTLLLGARWNSFREDVFNRLSRRDLATDDKGLRPRAALSWQVAGGVSLYASWGESLRLNPSDGNATFDAERSNSTEAGVKIALLGNRLTGTAAVFDMEKRNVINPNAIDPFVKSQIGQQRSNVPRHNVSLFALKTLGRVGIGGGVAHVGRRAGDPFGTPYRLPAYTIAPAVVRYALTDRVTAPADVDNLFDTYYISRSYSNVWTVPGAPRNIRLTVRAAF